LEKGGLPEPVARAIRLAAAETGSNHASIEPISIEPVDWPDASLGAPEHGVMYAQMITPGYRVVLRAGDRELIYHTDRGSRVVRVG
jgi:hypothetical protein